MVGVLGLVENPDIWWKHRIPMLANTAHRIHICNLLPFSGACLSVHQLHDAGVRGALHEWGVVLRATIVQAGFVRAKAF